MKILGIDPGIKITGYGLIKVASPETITLVEAGVIGTSSGQNIAERLKKIFENLTNIIDQEKPDVLVLEKLYSHYRHPTTSILMAHARGAICLLCGLRNMRLVNYPSTRIKKSITGNGHASKVQVQRTITDMLSLKKIPEPVDVTDAIALAVGFVNIELRGR